MAPVARELSAGRGILEPLLSETSVDGQVAQLRAVLEKHSKRPVTLIGFSWGAWLSLIFTANYAHFIKKLILISSGPFEPKYAGRIQETRWGRFSKAEKKEAGLLLQKLRPPYQEDPSKAFAKFGELCARADTYHPVTTDQRSTDPIMYRYDVFQSVWQEADSLRKKGKLMEWAGRLKCPVVAIHGDYDPHPAEGVKKPLQRVLNQFRFIELHRCGHKPWIEKNARDKFFEILRAELD
jgi:pimeloyl-ACP methyl ester carboxylesterase